MNLTGFRKALKKFEKATKIPVMDAYTSERIEVTFFATDKSVGNMKNELESTFISFFGTPPPKLTGFHIDDIQLPETENRPSRTCERD